MIDSHIRQAIVCLSLMSSGTAAAAAEPSTSKPADSKAELQLEKLPGAKPRNIVFILCDDHRYDAIGCAGHPFLETPHLDSLAKNGAHFKNAFVTTSLCSPSRATILTGLYVHRHRVIDNNRPVVPSLTFFPQYLQAAGYETAFVGKYHMGGGDDSPRPGWDHWVSFRGQGSYVPTEDGLNVDGRRVPQKGYITDELADYALDWLKSRGGDRPFMLYLSHKAVHGPFTPAERHKGRYKDAPVSTPKTQADTPENYRGKPMWVRNQRNSFHGVEFPYHTALDVADYYRRYCETLLAVDDSVGRVLDFLRSRQLLDSTLVIYMGDNGFCFGEHGLLDKRHAYEESMRVPFLAQCPELIPAGTKVEQMVANIDVAPTILTAAGLKPPPAMVGRDFVPTTRGRVADWRQSLLYEYYWEFNFPQTPTTFALRTEQYKLIHYHGIWDTDELYDVAADPRETENLIRVEAHQPTLRKLNRELFERLAEADALSVPFNPMPGPVNTIRRKSGSPAAQFPDYMLREPPPARK